MIDSQAFLNASGAPYELWYDTMMLAAHRHGISESRTALALWLAQVWVESAGYKVMEENLNYTHPDRLLAVFPAHFGRPGDPDPVHLCGNPEALANHVYCGRNGNVQPGDGWLYRGRGLIQLTGRANYQAYQDESAHPVINNPGMLSLPVVAADSAAWYFMERVPPAALIGMGDIVACTRAVNPALQGLEQRREAFERALRFLPDDCSLG